MGKVHLLNCKCTADLRLPQLNQSQIQKQIQIQMKIYNKYKKTQTTFSRLQMYSRHVFVAQLIQSHAQIFCNLSWSPATITFTIVITIIIILILVIFVGCFSGVTYQVCPQSVCPSRCEVTSITCVRFFSRVSFQMSSHIAYRNGCKVTLAALV